MSDAEHPLIDGESKREGMPYDTHYLDQIRTAGSNLHEWATTRVGCVMHSSAGPDQDATSGRPVCSVTGWSTVLVVPFYVDPDLRELSVTHDVRVAHGPHDRSQAEFQPEGIRVRYEVMSDPTTAKTQTINPNMSVDEFFWQQITHQVDATDWTTTAGRWDVLAISMQSLVEPSVRDASMWDGDSAPLSTVDADSADAPWTWNFIRGIWYPRQPGRIRVQSDNSYFYQSAYDTSQPNDIANEVTCSALFWSDDSPLSPDWNPENVVLVDHVGHRPRAIETVNEGITQRIWPPVDDLRLTPKEEVGGEQIDADEERFIKWVAKVWASYGQWRSITIEERRESPEQPFSARADEPPHAATYRRARQTITDTIRRTQLLSVGTSGYTTVGANRWHDNRYYMRHPWMVGEGGDGPQSIDLEVRSRRPYSEGQRRMRLIVAGVYEADQSGDDEWSDLVESGVEGTVVVCGTEHIVEFGPASVTPMSHWARAKSEQTIGGPEHITHLEGRLHVGMTGTDYDVPHVIDVPLPWGDDEAAVIEWPDNLSLSWVDEPGGLLTNDVGDPDPALCHLYVIGYCTYRRGETP